MSAPSQAFPTDRHGWSELLLLRAAAPQLTGAHRVAWCVVGAGFTGLSAARQLAVRHPDQEIILIDARQIGQGASGRNSGFAVAVSQFGGPYNPDLRANYERVNRINQAGLDMLRQQVRGNAIDCQWREDGIYHSAADRVAIAECADFHGYLQNLDVPHSVLNREEVAERLGTALYASAIHLPQGALVQPAALVRGLADSLPENVQTFENSPVLQVSAGAPVTLTLAKGQISADKVLLATNYEAPKLGYLKRYILGSTLSGSFTRILTEAERSQLGSLRDWGTISLHSGGATVRLTVDGRICLRNTAEYHRGALLSDAQVQERQVVHRAAFERRFPQLSHVPFEYFWSGVEGISGNFANFFGSQGGGVWLAGGYNGSGVSRGTAFGAALADHASGVDSDLVRDCLGSAPAQWLQPRPLLDIGAFFKVRSRFKGVGLDR